MGCESTGDECVVLHSSPRELRCDGTEPMAADHRGAGVFAPVSAVTSAVPIQARLLALSAAKVQSAHLH